MTVAYFLFLSVPSPRHFGVIRVKTPFLYIKNLKPKLNFWVKAVLLRDVLEMRYYSYKIHKLPFLMKANVGLHPQSAIKYYLSDKLLKKGPRELGTYFVFNSLRLMRYLGPKKFVTSVDQNYHLYLSKFLLIFLEKLYNTIILLNLKKGSNSIVLKKVGNRWFFYRYFKKFLQIDKRIIGILYYSLLLKDSSIFTNFLKSSLENLKNIKFHKKVLFGLKRLIRDVFKPVFHLLGVKGVFLTVKGKLGVSGNAKKRRYFFFFGNHKITTRSLKMDCKFTTISTYTGVLGVNFIIFF